MSYGRFAILDPAAGISGDMLLGALLAAGAPRSWLEELPARLGIGDVTVAVEDVDRCGVRATRVIIRLPGGEHEEPAAVLGAVEAGQRHAHAGSGDHVHNHPHSHDHASGHRHVGELIAMVERAPLSPWVRDRAVRAFRLLGEAEGRVHGMPPERVSLHEVGALDALVDIVGGIEGFEQLGIERIYTRPLALGDGWIRAAHGVLAVPAPATALLVEGLEIGPNGPVVGEATTPTGAVLLQVLSSGPPPPRWRAAGPVGWGAGGRNPTTYPNALRLLVGESVAEAGEVVILATDLDDLSPEYLEPMREALFAAGALDVQVWPTQSKKGRIGFRVEVTAAGDAVARISEAMFRHSTTAGLRHWRAERVTLPRRHTEVDAGNGRTVRVKILEGPDGPHAKPEYDDVAVVARETGRPAHQVARELQGLAVSQEQGRRRPDAGSGT